MRISSEPIAKQVFGSVLKRKILRFLFQDQEPISERELSRVLGVSHTAVNKAMKQLLELNIVKGKTVGTALVWELNKDSFAYSHVKAFLTASEISPLNSLKEMIETEVALYNTLINAQRQTRKKPLTKKDAPLILGAYIIGSVAEGTAKPESDLDLLIIIEDGHDTEFIRGLAQERGLEIVKKYGNQPSIHLYTKRDIEKNKPGWLDQAIRKGIKVV